ncbi:MAG: SDR family oxidoreductase [Ectothiorhodospiraceae bacterium]|nr:SDR family oxidoreductase [Ectothiorhodospiraceae bacterium]MCH8502724.1 SDR family oxidoreductase [Ectothiorhodospiraceae bacterium]
MKTLIIGAHGQIGYQFCTLAAAADFPIRAMIRDAGQSEDFEKIGVETVVADLEQDFSAAFEGCDQVVFTAGSGPNTGPDKTLLVDLYGAVRSIELSEELGIGRFIMVSAMRAEQPMQAPEKLRPYMAAKYAADVLLRRSRLEYVILKPGRLTDEPPTGRITTDPEAVAHNTISRGNVAQVLLAVATNRALRHREHLLLDGGEPVETVFS